jgi:hypothetical protein
MKHRIGVFDVWVYRKDPDAVRYLLLHASQAKADRWFNGGRFWQIPSNFVEGEESLAAAARRCLSGFGIEASAIWVVQHVYTIFNARFQEMQSILVLAAEAGSVSGVRLSWEHEESRWCTADECEALIGFRGLREGLAWTRRDITESTTILPELRLV